MAVIPQAGRFHFRSVSSTPAGALVELLRFPDASDAKASMGLDDVASWIEESRDPGSLTEFWTLEDEAKRTIGIAGLRAPSAMFLQFRAIGWRSLELIVALEPSQWGQGLAREAIGALAAHARANPVTFALVGAVADHNARANRLMRSAGFSELGRLTGAASAVIVYEKAL